MGVPMSLAPSEYEHLLVSDNFDWQQYAVEDEVPKIISPRDITERVLARFAAADGGYQGAMFPWLKCQQKGLRIRPREVSMYFGPNKCFKSQVTSQVCLGLMQQSEPAFIASFEMAVEDTMERMVMQAAANSQPSSSYTRRMLDWCHERLWLYNHHGSQQAEKTLAVCRYAATKLGVKHFFIDSLMKCVRDEDDYNGQKRFVEDLCGFVIAHDVHVHLVHHARKPSSSRERLTRYDAKGSGSISDQVWNVYIIERNREREEHITNGTLEGSGQEDKHDVYFRVDAQRNGRYEGTLGFWRHADSMSLVEQPCTRPPGLLLDVEG